MGATNAGVLVGPLTYGLSMTTDDYVHRAAEAFEDANGLNQRAVPIGYAVLTTAGETRSEDGQVFESHYSVRPFGAEDGHADRHFPDIDAVARYIDHVESLPSWRLDLTDDSIEVDGVNLTITDKARDESIYLGGGWWPMIGGEIRSGEVFGEGLARLAVRADSPPKFGRWRKDA